MKHHKLQLIVDVVFPSEDSASEIAFAAEQEVQAILDRHAKHMEPEVSANYSSIERVHRPTPPNHDALLVRGLGDFRRAEAARCKQETNLNGGWQQCELPEGHKGGCKWTP